MLELRERRTNVSSTPIARKYSRTPDNGAALGYTAVKIAAAALRNAGANPAREAVGDGFLKIKDFPVILGRGTFNFDSDRGARYEGVIMTVRNGKFVPAPEQADAVVNTDARRRRFGICQRVISSKTRCRRRYRRRPFG